MKALSLRQPWLWVVLEAGKRVENRVWNTRYRGPVLLHAALGCTRGEVIEAFDWMATAGFDLYDRWPGVKNVKRGGIVGRARIVDVIPPGGAQTRFVRDAHPGLDIRWHMSEQFGFVLDDVEPLPFVPWPGFQRLFDVPEDYASRSATP